jgi:hypothetical protein
MLLVLFLYPLGTDTLQYEIIYNGLQTWSDYIYLEPSFRGLVLFSNYLGLNLSGFYLLITGLTLLPVLYVTSKSRYQIAFFYYLSVFFFPYMINGIRQSLAMGLGLIALYMFNKGLKKKAIGFAFVGVSFHYGALIYFMYFLFASISKKLSIVVILFIFCFISLYGISIFGVGSSSIDFIDVLYRFILLFIFSLFVSKNNEPVLIFYLAGLLIYLALYFDAQLAARVHFYFRIVEVLILLSPLKNIVLSRFTTIVFIIFFLSLNLLIYV